MKIESTLHPIHAKRSNLNTMIYRPVFLNVLNDQLIFFAAKRRIFLNVFSPRSGEII